MDNFTLQNLAAAAGQQLVAGQQVLGQNIIQWPVQNAVPNSAQTQVLILAQQNPAVYVSPTGQLYTADSLRQQQQWINCFPTTSQTVVDTSRDPWQAAQSSMEVATSEAQVQYTAVTQPLTQVTQAGITDINQMYTEAELEAQAVAETLNHLRNQQIVHHNTDSPNHNSYSSTNNTDPDPDPNAGEGNDWITIKIENPPKTQKATSSKESRKREKAAKMETLQAAQVPMQSMQPLQAVVLPQLAASSMVQLQQGDSPAVHSTPPHSLPQPHHTIKMESTVQTIDIEMMESLDTQPKMQATPTIPKKKKKKKKEKEKTSDPNAPPPEKKPRKGGSDSKAGSYKCMDCGALFAWARNLNRHMRKHTGQRPYACESCNATFTQNSHLKVHRLKHTGERPYVCMTCQASFTRSSYLNRHMLKHTESAHIPTPTAPKSKKSKKTTKDSGHTVIAAGPTLAEITLRPDAEAAEHGLTTINFPDALSTDIVPVNGLKEALPKKKKKKDKESMSASTEVQTMEDGVLNLSTTRPEDVAAVVIKQEVEVKPRQPVQRHECKVCQQTFLLVSSLNRHMLKHSGDKVQVHACKQCDAVFTQADHLQRHMLKHAGEKRYACDACGQSFTKSSHLTKHMMTKHPAKPKPANS